MKSSVYRFCNNLFRYDFDHCIVEQVMKADKGMIAENESWKKKYGDPMYDIDQEGYCVIGTVGLSLENWKDKEARNEYLDGWIQEMNEESERLVQQFLRFG